jgi:hypothetical protein
MADALERPSHLSDVGPVERRTKTRLPEAFDTWGRFWDEVGIDPFPEEADDN